jgi:hypothetical protein
VASSPYAGTASPYASQDYYPQEYTEYRDPVEHAKEKIKKLDKKIAKKEKRRKQKLEDAKTAAETLIALGVWNAILWLVPLFGNKWYTKMFNGFGHLIVTISLWSINVVVECKMMDWGFGLDKVVMADYDPNYRILHGHIALEWNPLAHRYQESCMRPSWSGCTDVRRHGYSLVDQLHAHLRVLSFRDLVSIWKSILVLLLVCGPLEDGALLGNGLVWRFSLPRRRLLRILQCHRT